MNTGLVNMGIGVLLAAVGLAVTIGSHALVSGSGGTYFVAWGAIAVGAWRFLLGLYQLLRGGLSHAPIAAAQTKIEPLPVAGGLPKTSRSAEPTDALPGPVRVIGILLLVQAVVRLVFLTILLLQMRSAYLNSLQFIITSVMLPAILAGAGIVAGVLALKRLPAARGFGLTFCTLGLLYQLYGLGNLIYAAFTLPSFHVVWTSWVLNPAYICIYLAGLVVFGWSRFYKAQS